MASLDDVLDLLSRKRRRYALYYLAQQDSPVPIGEVARQVATWETDPAAVTIPEGKYQEVQIEMYHNHLPHADEMEFIEYDRESRTVNITGSPPEFEVFLTMARVIEQPSTGD